MSNKEVKIIITKPFRDIHTGDLYAVGDKVTFTEARILEARGNIGAGYFELEAEAEAKAKAEAEAKAKANG